MIGNIVTGMIFAVCFYFLFLTAEGRSTMKELANNFTAAGTQQSIVIVKADETQPPPPLEEPAGAQGTGIQRIKFIKSDDPHLAPPPTEAVKEKQAAYGGVSAAVAAVYTSGPQADGAESGGQD